MAEQARDYLIVSFAIGGAYVLMVLVACLAHAHRILGPLIPIRTHIEGMKNGDYSSVLRLRSGDPFVEIADDLNELASLLREQAKRED